MSLAARRLTRRTPSSGGPSGDNILLTKVFTTDVPDSQSEPGHPASLMTDGDTTTRWISQPASPANATIDMQGIYDLSSVTIVFAADTIRDYTISISSNGTSWTTLATGTTNNTEKQTITHSSLSGTTEGRYLRITATTRWNSAYGNSIYEVTAHGTFLQSVPTGTISNFTATTISNTQINLAWAYTGSPLTNYTLRRGSTTIASPASSATTYSDTGLSPGTTYSYTLTGNLQGGGVTNTGSVGGMTSGTNPLLTPPANPNLSPEGRNVLAYLQGLEGNGMLAGQQETDQHVRSENDRLQSITGKYPAVNGHEVADYTVDPMAEAIVAWRDHRRLQSFSWHAGAPPLDDYSWTNCQGTSDINRVLTPGTAEYNSWVAKQDKMAGRLQVLQNAGVPVLWRPLHEMNGNWFWWSKGGSSLYRQLWIQHFNYFTHTKGLNNLIWVWAAAEVSLPNAAWYPGDQYVDITGSDTYSSRSNTSNWKAHYDGHKALAPSKISALTECDYMPDPTAFDNQNIGFVWFLPWYGQWVNMNSQATMTSVYNHSYVITADEMPDLK